MKSEGSRRQNAGLTNRKRLRRRNGVRRPISSKPDTCTERYDVKPTGISRKVARITPGDLLFCQKATDTVRCQDGAAEVSRCRSRDVKPTSRRAEPVTSGKSRVLSERVVDTSCENNAGLSNEEVGGGTPDGRFRCLDYAGDTMHETDSCGEGIQCRQEPPYAEPHVRWCERTEAARPPPTRLLYLKETPFFCSKAEKWYLIPDSRFDMTSHLSLSSGYCVSRPA